MSKPPNGEERLQKLVKCDASPTGRHWVGFVRADSTPRNKLGGRRLAMWCECSTRGDTAIAETLAATGGSTCLARMKDMVAQVRGLDDRWDRYRNSSLWVSASATLGDTRAEVRGARAGRAGQTQTAPDMADRWGFAVRDALGRAVCAALPLGYKNAAWDRRLRLRMFEYAGTWRLCSSNGTTLATWAPPLPPLFGFPAQPDKVQIHAGDAGDAGLVWGPEARGEYCALCHRTYKTAEAHSRSTTHRQAWYRLLSTVLPKFRFRAPSRVAFVGGTEW